MKLIYKDVDITDDAQILAASITDCAGGKADSLAIVFANPELWDKWSPQYGDTVRLQQDGFDSGVMYVDEMGRQTGAYLLRALSVPSFSKIEHTRTWRNATLLMLARDVAAAQGLTLMAYDITDYRYEYVEQDGETDLAFLQRHCAREGYTVKVVDGRLAVLDEHAIMLAPPGVTVEAKPGYEFISSCKGLKAACTVSYMRADGMAIAFRAEAPGVAGGELKIVERVSSQAEAERFARSYLRRANGGETVGAVSADLNVGLAAGMTAEVLGAGAWEGAYYVDRVEHRLTAGRSSLYLRKPVEGY